MKKIIFLFHFLVLLSAFNSFAQVNYNITAPPSLTMCGNRQSMQVTLNSAATTTNVDFQLDFSVTGIQVYDPQTTAGVTYVGFAQGSNNLIVHVDQVTGSVPLILSLDIWAGCGVEEMGTLQTLSAAIQVKDLGTSITTTRAITINENINGNLLYPSNDPSWSQPASIGDVLTREFVYSNTTLKPYTGVINVNDVFEANTALSILSLEIIYSDNSIQTLSNNTTATLSKTINAGQTVRIRERVKVEKCIDVASLGKSTLTIKRGCSMDELCYSDPQFSLEVTKAPGEALIHHAATFIRDTPYWQCFDEPTFHDASMEYTNDGTAPANDLKFIFLPATNYYTDKSSFVVEIVGISGNVRSSGNVVVNHALLPGQSDYGFCTGGCESGTFNDYRDIVWDLSNPNDYVRSQIQTCGTTEYLNSKVITDYIDAQGVQRTIVLAPGEKVRIKWRDKHCCFRSDAFITDRLYVPMLRAFLNDCSGALKQVDGIFSYSYNGFTQNVLPFNPSLNANADKCMSTNDGETRVISIQNTAAYYGFLPTDANAWGDLVVDLDIDNGADLDITLNGTALPESYNHNSCGFASCGNTCSVSPMSISDPGRYEIRFVDDATGKILMPATTPVKISTSATGSKYRIIFSYRDLDALTGSTHNGNIVSAFLTSMRLEFKIRSVCPAPPTTNIVETLSYRANQALCGPSGCLMPLYRKNLHVTVVCPGCITPGGNVSSSVLERAPAFLGLTDNDNDGIPDNNNQITDPILKLNCTNGDELIGTVTAFISDGDVGGYTLANLASKGISVDNLYLKIQPSIGNVLISNTTQAEVSIDNVNWHSTNFIQAGGDFITHVNSAALGLPNFNGFAGGNIYVRYRLNVIREDIINDEPKPSQLIYIIAHAYFSDCDNCIDATTNDWSFPGGDASNTICDWPNSSASCNLDNKFYWCSSNESLINYIPTSTLTRKTSGQPNVCKPSLSLQFGVKQYTKNSFPKEYRTYFNDGPQTTFTLPIPTGYRVSSLRMDNLADAQYYTVSKGVRDVFYLSTNEEFVEAVQNGLVSMSSGNMVLTLNYEKLNQTNTLLGDRTWDVTKPIKYTGQKLRVADDAAYTVLEVYFEPIDCKNVPFESVYADGPGAKGMVHAPYALLADPMVLLPLLPNSSAGNKEVPTNNYSLIYIHEPDTKLDATAPSSVFPDQNRYFIPVSIDNTDPVDAQGQPVQVVDTRTLSSVDAYNPFIFLTNKAALAAKGITVEGVYEGIVNAGNISGSTNFYDASNGIASLKKNGQPYIPGNTRNNQYTMVVKYACPQGCSPVLPECTSADQGSSIPACITDVKQLQLLYGWNCNAYPKTSIEVTNACETKTLAPITINTPTVALEVTPSINNNAAVTLCKDFEYKLVLKSCKKGNIDKLDVTINLPANVEFVSSTLPATTSTNTIVLNDVTGGTLFNDGIEKTVIVLLRLKNATLSTVDISTTVNGTSYCASVFTKTKTITAPVQATIVGINATGIYCANGAPVQITTTVGPGTFTALTGLVDHGDGTAIFSPTNAGVGSYTITYTTNTPEGCIGIATKAIQVIATPIVTTNIPSVLCVGSAPFVLSSSPTGAVFSGAGVTNNTNYQFHGDQLGFYNVQYTYTSTSGCVVVGQKTIHVEDFTVNLSTPGLACIGESVNLTATINGSTSGSLTYTWNKVVSGTTVYLNGPSATNTYSFSNYSGATIFQVSASNGSCTVVSNQLTVNPNSADECCRYKLGDITLDCSTITQNICVPLTAVRDVPTGIIGMDFCLKYDPTIMKYTGPTGNNTSNTLGTVVTNGGLYGATYATYNDVTNGVLRVSIYYSGSGNGLASFKGSGEIICLNFSVANSTARQGIFPITMCNVNDLQEAYTLEEKAACWKAGSLKIQLPDVAKGRLQNPLYSNSIWGRAYTYSYANTTLTPVGADCDLQNLLPSTTIVGTGFSVPVNGATKIKLKRDVHGDLAIPRMQYQLVVNGSDSWKIHRITTMDPVLNSNTTSNPQTSLFWYSMTAADVNMNGHVRANDISLVQERIVGKRNEFPQVWNNGLSSPSLDWRFVDETTVYSNASFKKSTVYPNSDGTGFYRENAPNIPLCLDVKKNCVGQIPELYFGVMLGDVYPSGASANYPGTNNYLRESSSTPSFITIDAKHAQYLDNNIYRVPVIHHYNYEYMDKLFAIDMYIDYNQQKIRVNNVLYTSVTSDGGVSMMWNNADEDEFILTSYATLDSIAATGISYYLDIEKFTDEPFKKADFGTLQFLLNGELVEAKIETGETATGTTGGQSAIKPHVTVIPNPASGAAMIDFAVSNNSNNNRIIITDVLGRMVKSFEHIQNFGMLDFNTEDLAAGMYIITLKGENGFGLSEKFQVRK